MYGAVRLNKNADVWSNSETGEIVSESDDSPLARFLALIRNAIWTFWTFR